MIASQEPESSGPLRSLRGLEAAYLRPYRRQMVWALAAMIVQSLLLLPLPWIQGSVIDRLARGGDVRTMVAAAVAILVICQLGRMGLAWLSSSAMNRISLEFVRALTDGLHRKLQRLPLAWFDRQETGQVMSRLTSDVGTLLIFLSASSLQLAADLVLAAGIVIVLVLLAWPLAIASFIALPLFVWNQRHFASRLMTLSQDVQGQTARLFAVLSERISAVRTVRAFGMEPREIDLFRGRLDSHAASSRQRLRAMSLQSLAALLTSGLATAVVVVMAAMLIQRQWLSLGQAAAFVAYLGLLYLPLVRLTQFYGGISATLAAVQRIAEVLDEPEPAPLRHLNSRRRVRGELRLQNVSFRYCPNSPAVLHRIHMAIQPGSTIGLWGPSGAGKSTLLALLPRLYDLPPGCGRILLDGRDVAALPPAELRRSVMLVPQQARLFAGTMRFNLTYAAPDADESLIRRALDAVDLAELVESLPQGLETPVGERGASLSGGQRQRLALARALIAQPRVLLLDDCTSALDAQTEARVRQRALDFSQAQTRIIASHKPEAFAGVDWLVCLEGGQIVRQGTPQKLLAEGALAQNALALVS